MLKAYKYRLYPSPAQREALARTFGCTRYVYNWALERKVAAYRESSTSVSRYVLDKELTLLKGEHPWLREVASQPLQQAIGHLDRAFTAFFKKRAAFPRFKSRRGKQSAHYPQGVRLFEDEGRVTIPKLGRVKARVSRPLPEGRIKTCVVSQSPSGRYFLSVLVEVENQDLPTPVPDTEEEAVGVDVGLTHFATLSTGEKIPNPRHLCKAEARLKVLQRRLAKKQKGSSNREKARRRVARAHERVADARADFLHKLSRRLVDEYGTLVFEDLNVAGMVKNHALAKSISDAGWATLKRLCSYKAAEEGKHIREIGRFEPSSRLCDECFTINSGLTLGDRVWTCDSCGAVHDRDILAARNIRSFGYRGTATQPDKGTKRSGPGRPGELVETPLEESGSVKQESRAL